MLVVQLALFRELQLLAWLEALVEEDLFLAVQVLSERPILFTNVGEKPVENDGAHQIVVVDPDLIEVAGMGAE